MRLWSYKRIKSETEIVDNVEKPKKVFDNAWSAYNKVRNLKANAKTRSAFNCVSPRGERKKKTSHRSHFPAPHFRHSFMRAFAYVRSSQHQPWRESIKLVIFPIVENIPFRGLLRFSPFGGKASFRPSLRFLRSLHHRKRTAQDAGRH